MALGQKLLNPSYSGLRIRSHCDEDAYMDTLGMEYGFTVPILLGAYWSYVRMQKCLIDAKCVWCCSVVFTFVVYMVYTKAQLSRKHDTLRRTKLQNLTFTYGRYTDVYFITAIRSSTDVSFGRRKHMLAS